MKTTDEIIRVLKEEEAELRDRILHRDRAEHLPELRRIYQILKAVREFAEAPSGTPICYGVPA